jgi:hypothetical protein
MTPTEGQALDEGVKSFNDELRTAGAWVSAEGFDEEARTTRFADGGATVSDGSFADTPEQLGGFWIIDVADLGSAVEWGRRPPYAAARSKCDPCQSRVATI